MIILYSTKGKTSKNQNISYRLALIMGVAQIFALFPGISRAGITICAGLLVGASQNAVARFSFFMAIPALLGAIAFELDNIIIAIETEPSVILLGLIFSMTTGLLALKLLFKVLQKQNLWIFAYYCLFIWLIITTIVYNG